MFYKAKNRECLNRGMFYKAKNRDSVRMNPDLTGLRTLKAGTRVNF